MRGEQAGGVSLGGRERHGAVGAEQVRGVASRQDARRRFDGVGEHHVFIQRRLGAHDGREPVAVVRRVAVCREAGGMQFLASDEVAA